MISVDSWSTESAVKKYDRFHNWGLRKGGGGDGSNLNCHIVLDYQKMEEVKCRKFIAQIDACQQA